MLEQNAGKTTAMAIGGFSSPSCAREPSDFETAQILKAIWGENLYIGDLSWSGSTNPIAWQMRASIEPKYVALEQVLQHAELSRFSNPVYGKFTLDFFENGERLLLKKRVREISKVSERNNWDGEGASALDPSTLETAQGLVDVFPVSAIILQPDVSATPQGEVDFDWVVSQDTMLTVSACPSGEIAFAGIFGAAQLDGKEPWVGGLPYFIEMCLQRLHLERLRKNRNPDYHDLW